MHADYRHHYAGMVTFWYEMAYSYRFIIAAATPREYVQELSTALKDAMQPLLSSFYGRLDSAMGQLQNSFSEEVPAGEYSNADIIVSLVDKLPTLALQEFDETGSASVYDSRWFEVIDAINTEISGEAGLFVPVEGRLPVFLARLHRLEARRIRSVAKIADSEAIWLGKLSAVARRRWTSQTSQDHWLVVNSLFAAFDERNSQFNG